jgi:hypothetical protein
MYHEYFIQKGVLLLPIIAMLAFVATFVAVVLATYRSQKRAEFDHMSQLPKEHRGRRGEDRLAAGFGLTQVGARSVSHERPRQCQYAREPRNGCGW